MVFKTALSTCFLAAGFISLVSAQTTTKFTGIEGKITQAGTTAFPSSGSSTLTDEANASPDGLQHKVMPKPNLRAALQRSIRLQAEITKAAVLKAPTPTPTTVVGAGPTFHGFPGLNSVDTGNVNKFVLEPPDQGLAVGNGFVFEAINDVFAIYDTSGVLISGPVSANKFFKLAPAIQGNTAGPSLTDPRAYFDHQLQRWFVTMLEFAPNGRSYLLLAVSSSADPFSSFYIYSIDATNDGTHGTPAHPGCPCFPDQPLIGADRNGFYISGNEFGAGFNGAVIYALSKDILAFGALPTPIIFSGLPLAEAVSYSVQPAISLGFDREAASGVEYFLSSLDFTGTLDNRIAIWAMTDTSSLNGFHPTPTLIQRIVPTEVYGQPPPAVQPSGPFPLGTSLKEPLEDVDTNDDRMNQVVFENGKLWAGLNTQIGASKGNQARAGIAYFVLTPKIANGNLTAGVVREGYLAAPGQDSIMYPSIGVTPSGKAAMTFTLVGPTATPAFSFTPVFYPSMAFTTLSAMTGTGVIQLGGAGYAPEDGFSGYAAFGGSGVARWGDYSAAYADTDGSIWMAAEWIPNAPRTRYTNWGTFIGQLR